MSIVTTQAGQRPSLTRGLGSTLLRSRQVARGCTGPTTGRRGRPRFTETRRLLEVKTNALRSSPLPSRTRRQARQRVLDATGNLKAVQKLLGHASIQTTVDIYADWDIDQLARTLADVLSDEDE